MRNGRDVLFDTPPDFVAASLAVTAWRVQTPARYVIDLDRDGEPYPLLDGTVVRVARFLEQANGSLIQFDVDLTDEHGFEGGFAQDNQTPPGPVASGVGVDWTGFAFLPSNFARPQLTYLPGGTPPKELQIRIESAQWHGIQAETPIPLPGT